MPRPTPRAAVVAIAWALSFSSAALAAPPSPKTSGYDQPPQAVLDVLHAPPPPQPVLSPRGDALLLVTWVQYPSIEQVAEPFLRLAGVRVEPRTRRKHDTPGGYGVAPCAASVTLVDLATSGETKLALPPGGCADGFSWSADGQHVAFSNTASQAVEAWLADVATGQTKRLSDARLNPMLGSAMRWMPDQKTLLVKLVPEKAGTARPEAVATIAPSIQETTGARGESSTYEARDVLTGPRDVELFDDYATSQLALLDTATGAITRLGRPGVFSLLDPSPDGAHLLVISLRKPYSYVVTHERFAHDVEVWNTKGEVEHVVAKLPVADRVPIRGVPVGPRDFEWRPTEPATLVWAEALDQGDWAVKVPARDRVMTQRAPFNRPPVEMTRTVQRFVGFDWSEQRSVALLHEYNEDKHWRRVFVMNPDEPKSTPSLLWDLSTDERYRNPGSPVYRVLPNGQHVVRHEGDTMFLKGQGATPEGDRPFLDRLDLKARKTERLFRSEKTGLEQVLGFTGDTHTAFLTWRQSPMDPPNAHLRTLGDAVSSPAEGDAAFTSTIRAVTHLPDPTPAVRAIKKRLVKYQRKDGTELSFTLYTPPGYREGTRVPAILYAYPLDYAEATKAGQVSGSDQTFTRLSNHRLLLLAGYAIIDNAAFPIVGDPTKAYDTYLEQLIDDAQAAVDKAVELGVVDRDRIGVTGHSHGALMTVNLVTHTSLFRAGVATSGSYNKTLTPFGFQNERRSVWKAQDVYLKVSPFFFADQVKTPLLIVHGADDANPGTTPLQATKLYEAIRGNGGIARLVMLPYEPHWYAAMQSNEQLAYEEIRWFDQYVKGAAPKTTFGAPNIKESSSRGE